MARIFKNKTDTEVEVSYGTITQTVAANSQYDLALTFAPWQLASSESLVELLGQGIAKYQLNDGVTDLTVTQAIDLIKGYQTAYMTTQDGRLTVRQTTANKGTNYRLRCVSFYTADPSKLCNKKADGTDYGDVIIKCFDATGAETTEPHTTAVKTQIDFEPAWDYEIIGGTIDIPTSIQGGTTDAWFVSCTAVPDVSEEMGGSIAFCNLVNIEAILTKELDLDGRATSFMPYSEAYHTNKIRVQFLHPAGQKIRFQLYLELFR